MSHTTDIVIDEPLFQFDSFDEPVSPSILHHFPLLQDSSDSSTHPTLSADHSIPDDQPPSITDVPSQTPHPSIDASDKGKSVSQPVPIRNITTIDVEHDIFDLSPFRCSSPDHHSTSPAPSYFDFRPIRSPLDDIFHDISSVGYGNSPWKERPSPDRLHGPTVALPDKGKGREVPPSLPPLAFSPTEFGYGKVLWPSPGTIAPPSGPSSYGSGYGSPTRLCFGRPFGQSLNSANDPVVSLDNKIAPPTVRRMPSRRRSLSSLSIRSTHSLTARSMTKLKAGASKIPDSLSRKLFCGKPSNLADPQSDKGSGADLRGLDVDWPDVGQSNCLTPWRADLKSRKGVTADGAALKLDPCLGVDQPSPRRNHGFKVNGRSNSSPLPFSTVGIITPAPSNVLMPTTDTARNYFDETPRELRLAIVSSLLTLHEAEYERYKAEGKWTALRAASSMGKWVGKDRGRRELVKLSRVSKSWQSLVFDGQLWTNFDLRGFPKMPTSLILRLAGMAGSFIRALDFTGHGHLLPATLSDLTTSLCPESAPLGSLSYTQLTSVNLQGCPALTTRSLHHLLIRSPSLQRLCLKGLLAVTNTTCDVLAAYCPQLVSLDLSRCSLMDGSGLLSLASAALSRGEFLLLEELRLSGLKHIDDTIMATLGKAAPYLEVLDLSYARQLHNSALEAFISCEDEVLPGVDTILLTSREAGRDPGDPSKYRRRITHLRHLCLSSCILLTGIACSNLAFTMPHLEFLELAGIGSELRDDGLVHLLDTTPFIRRLDLEDASEITDRVIEALTPSAVTDPAQAPSKPQTGHALERLTISFANNVTDDAFLSLIRGCTRLQVLEADNTRISGAVLKEFVQLARERRMTDSRVVAIDCRGIGETLVKEIAPCTRPRQGWRSYDARKLKYVDSRDKEELKVGQDECDETRVVLKTFYSWQTVDAVKAAREKRRKSVPRRAVNGSNGNVTDSEEYPSTTGRARWWAPGSGRRISGGNSPTMLDTNSNEGCRVM